MDTGKLIEEWATIILKEREDAKGRNSRIVDKRIEEDIYESNGKKVIYYRGDCVEVKKLTSIEKIYYELDYIEGSVWRGVDTLETLFKIHRYNLFGFEMELIGMKDYDYSNWQSVIRGYSEKYTRWSNLLIKDKEEFELLKDVYQIYSPVYCHQGIVILHSEGNLHVLLKVLRKNKVERSSRFYDLFNDAYSKDRRMALETLFQEPIDEGHLAKLDKRIAKGESIKELYEIVKIYPYITIEECLKGNKKFKNKYREIKDKLESMEDDEILEEVPFEDIKIDNELINKQFNMEYEQLVNTNEMGLDNEEGFEEGRKTYGLHRTIERNPKVVKMSKDIFKKNNNGKLFCEVCGFDFEKVYGERGEGFIEAHHEKPVSEMKQGESTKIKNMRMVCPNCHRMLHKNLLITIEELKLIILKNNKCS